MAQCTSLKRRKTIAWLAAAALLFSALSPAVASVLFAERPDILARVLGAAAKRAASDESDVCPHDASAAGQPGSAQHRPDDGSEHVSHGIFCSFCLAPGAIVTL